MMTRSEYRKARDILNGHKSKAGFVRFADGSAIVDHDTFFSYKAKDGQTVDTAFLVENFQYLVYDERIQYGCRV